MPKRILIADDEQNIARLTQVNLQRAGYTVDIVHDGLEALARIRAAPPDLVITDVMMPHLDGFELLRRLKESEDTRGVPVILLTVKAQDRDILHAEEAGAAAYLPKPFTPVELLAIVEQAIAVGTANGGT